MADLSQVSTADLKNFQAGNLKAISTPGLLAIQAAHTAAAPQQDNAAPVPAAASPQAAPSTASPPSASTPPTPAGGGDSILNTADKMTQDFGNSFFAGTPDEIGAKLATGLEYAGGVLTPGKGRDLADINAQNEKIRMARQSALQDWNDQHEGLNVASQAAGALSMMGPASKIIGAAVESLPAIPGVTSALSKFASASPKAAKFAKTAGTVSAAGAGFGGVSAGSQAAPGDTLEATGEGAGIGAGIGLLAKYGLEPLVNEAVGAIAPKIKGAGSALQDFLKTSESSAPEAAGNAAQPSPTFGYSNITNQPLGAAPPEAGAPITGKLPLSPGVANKDTNLLRIEENAKQGLLGPDAQNKMAESNANVVQAARNAMQSLKGVTNKDSDSILSGAVGQFQTQANSVKGSAQALYKKRDDMMADAIVNRKAAAATVGKDMFGVLTDPSNIAGFKSNSGAAAKQLYSDFRDLMKGTPDSTVPGKGPEGTVSTSLPSDHPDAPYTYGMTAAAPTGYKNPILKWIADRGGVVKGSQLDTALRDMDFGPGKPGTPVGLFKNKISGGKIAGRATIDNVPASEFNDKFGSGYVGDEQGHMQQEDIIDAIRNEQFASKNEDPTGQQQQFKDTKDEVFKRAQSLGAKGMTNHDVEKMATEYANGAGLDETINGHMQDKYFADQQPSNIKTFAAKDALPFNSLAAWRQDAAHLAQTDESTSGHLAKKMIAAYENWMDNVPQNAFLSGSKDVATAARDAGSAWKNYKTLFGSENSPVISGMVKPYDATPADFVDKVFGANIAGNGNTALNVRKMVAALPTEAQQGFKNNVFSGLISRVFEGAGDADQVSLGKLRNNLSALQNSAVYKEHFASDATKDPIITNLIKDLSQQITQTGRKDIVSPSGGAVMRGLGQLTGQLNEGMGKYLPFVPEAHGLVSKISDMGQSSADKAAFKKAMYAAQQAAHKAARSGPVFDIDSLKAGITGGLAAGNVVKQSNGGTAP